MIVIGIMYEYNFWHFYGLENTGLRLQVRRQKVFRTKLLTQDHFQFPCNEGNDQILMTSFDSTNFFVVTDMTGTEHRQTFLSK